MGMMGPGLKKERKKYYKQVTRSSAIVLEMGFSVAIGVAIGYYLDRHFDTSPWLTLIFLFLGVVAGFRSLFSLMKDLGKNKPRE
jgi:ATP synthase protein I